MTSIRILFAVLALAACDVVAPSRVTAPIESDATPMSILNAAAVVLLREGYAVAALEPDVGILTTGWQDETSFSDQVFLDTSRRSRISVVLDFNLRQLDVQMTVQKKDADYPWRNDDLSGRERNRLTSIVEAIQDRIGPAAAARPAFR
jgi:hypothetical protein